MPRKKTLRNYGAVFIAILLEFLVAIGSGHATELEPLPTPQNVTIEDFKSQSQGVKQQYDQDSALDFTIQIPKNFVIKAQDDLKNLYQNNRLEGDVFYAYGRAVQDMRPYIRVQSVGLDRMMHIGDWMRVQALSQNYTLKTFDESQDRLSFEAFYIRLDDYGRMEIVRAKGIKNENRLVLVEFVVPRLLWNELRDIQIHSTQSITFLNDYDISHEENTTEYEYLDVLSVRYPLSWRLQGKETPTITQHNIALQTVDDDGFLLADIQLILASDRPLSDQISHTQYPIDFASIMAAQQTKIKDKGLSAGQVMEERTINVGVDSLLNKTEIYPLHKQQSDIFVLDKESPVTHEYWLTVIKTKKMVEKNYIISMIVPARDVDFNKWAIATRAYEFVVESIR